MASIRKLTVLFQGKKIDLRITKTGEKTYNVSYSDNKLVLNDRAEFERRMKDRLSFNLGLTRVRKKNDGRIIERDRRKAGKYDNERRNSTKS
jgi:hypothetical protein